MRPLTIYTLLIAFSLSNKKYSDFIKDNHWLLNKIQVGLVLMFKPKTRHAQRYAGVYSCHPFIDIFNGFKPTELLKG